jgi:hypothetical protein
MAGKVRCPPPEGKQQPAYVYKNRRNRHTSETYNENRRHCLTYVPMTANLVTRMRSLELLAHVAREGRYLTGESPEQVGEAAGVAGRTIRRIEDPRLDRCPRRLTLETLAHYYSLDATLLVWLSGCGLDGDALEREVRGRATRAGVDSASTLARVALALARVSGGETAVPEDEKRLVVSFRRLDSSRRRIAAVMVEQLLLAQAEQRRRREGSASHRD